MQITENHIQRFFDQQCSAEEARTVVSFLQEHPEIVAQWLGPDWKQAGKEIPVPTSYRQEMLDHVKCHIYFEKPVKKLQTMKLVFMAAAAVMVLLAGYWFFTTEYKATEPAKIVADHSAALELRVNLTKNPLAILLPDHSVATIEPGTQLQFEKNFSGNERRIQLRGNGFFEVKKNSLKPFIVVSGQITTTALGTSFRVIENTEGVTVKLYTGKVVVNKIGSKTNWSGPVYLLPGTAMTYSEKEKNTTVSGFIPEKENKKQYVKHQLQQLSTQPINNELIFDNTPLVQVLEAIEKRYAVIITYDEQNITGRYFTGKVLPTDAVEVILQVIGNINELSIQKEASNRFTVTKNQ